MLSKEFLILYMLNKYKFYIMKLLNNLPYNIYEINTSVYMLT